MFVCFFLFYLVSYIPLSAHHFDGLHRSVGLAHLLQQKTLGMSVGQTTLHVVVGNHLFGRAHFANALNPIWLQVFPDNF